MMMKSRTTPNKTWQAFFILLAQYSPDDISVGKMCTLAQVHHSSFYRYFGDLVAHYHIGGMTRIITICLQNPHATQAELMAQIDVLVRFCFEGLFEGEG